MFVTGDAILIVSGRSVSLLDLEGKEIGKSSGYKLQELAELKEGETLSVGAKEIEVGQLCLDFIILAINLCERVAKHHCEQGVRSLTLVVHKYAK